MLLNKLCNKLRRKKNLSIINMEGPFNKDIKKLDDELVKMSKEEEEEIIKEIEKIEPKY